jgi:hypothetical protein
MMVAVMIDGLVGNSVSLPLFAAGHSLGGAAGGMCMGYLITYRAGTGTCNSPSSSQLFSC